MKTFKEMLKIEGKLSIRDMNMVIFALVMPIVVMIIIGIVFGEKPAFEGAEYTFMEQSFGALCSVSICAGGLMGLPLLVAEYRERKILKRFKVTPISPTLILCVHVYIYTLYSAVSLVLLWGIGKWVWHIQMRGSFFIFLLGWFLVLTSILSIGMLVGGIAKNSKQASIIASVLYFPMLVFSGATLPYEMMPIKMQRTVDLLPMTQGIKILKAAMLGLPLGQVWLPILLLLGIAGVCIGISVKCFRWEA